jgi:transcriptional regulator with XRE-family HTH domain
VPRYFDDLAPITTASVAGAGVDEQVREFRLERVRQGMDAGWTNAQLATDLGVSSGTVEKLKRDVRGAPSEHNDLQRAARLERAQAALELQRSGLSRAEIAEKLEVSVESVKELLRDAKFYADPATDSARRELANAAHAERAQGTTREQFQRARGLTNGKASESWRDAAVLNAPSPTP